MLRESQSTARNLETEITPAREEKILRPHWWGQDHADNYEGRCRRAIEMFMTGKFPKKFSTYGENHYARPSRKGGRHILSTRNNGTELWMFKNNPSIRVHVCVARKVNGVFVGNSSGFGFLRQQNGKVKPIAQRLKIQEVCAEAMPMVPFIVFKQAQLNLDSMNIIEKAPDEMIDVGRKEKGKPVLTHYTGALLFTLEYNKRSKGLRGSGAEFYLFDIDRNDLKLKNFNAFLSKLAKPARSIKEAYDLLKPDEVRNAERFLKDECPRQGEWFFIPVQGRFKRRREMSWSGRGRPRFVEARLESKGNRAHYVKFLSEEGYVTGKVWHGGHEHKDLVLKGWHKPVPNSAIQSFKISGAVD